MTVRGHVTLVLHHRRVCSVHLVIQLLFRFLGARSLDLLLRFFCIRFLWFVNFSITVIFLLIILVWALVLGRVVIRASIHPSHCTWYISFTPPPSSAGLHTFPQLFNLFKVTDFQLLLTQELHHGPELILFNIHETDRTM